MPMTAKEFRDMVRREEAERRARPPAPPTRDWIDEIGDEIEKHPILSPRVRRRVNRGEK
jgi:hypothetical protein